MVSLPPVALALNGCRLDGVLVLEGVVGVHGVGGEDLAAHGDGVLAGDVQHHVGGFARVGVDQRDPGLAVLAARGRGADAGDALAVLAVGDVVRQRDRQRGRVLERHVHLVGVVGRRQQHLVLLGDDHGLQHVDHLRDVGHAHAVGVGVEDVEVEGRHHGVADGVALEQEARVGARLDVVPGAPFVDVEADLLLRVVLVEDGDVAADVVFHAQRVRHGREPFAFREAGGGALLPICRSAACSSGS
jgi:hypothetical protein